MYYWFGTKIKKNFSVQWRIMSPCRDNWMSPFNASVSIRQCQDGPCLAVISSIPSVIIRGEQHIFPGLSFLCTPSLLIPDPLFISSAQCVIYLKCFMVSVSAVVDELNLRHTPSICATRTSARGTQREYNPKPLKHSIVKLILVFKR